MRSIFEQLTGIVFAIVVAGLVATVGCDRDDSGEASAETMADEQIVDDREADEEADGEEQNPYSPFGVELADGRKFHLISFKDVGLKPDASTSREMLFEAVAQSISYELRADNEFELRPRVIYDEALADPNNHTYCEKNRLYVDIWHGTEPERWGYSLWSGCSEAQQFAWREIEDERAISAELDESVTPLARGIVESLTEAAEDDCYRRAC